MQHIKIRFHWTYIIGGLRPPPPGAKPPGGGGIFPPVALASAVKIVNRIFVFYLKNSDFAGVFGKEIKFEITN